MKSNHSHTVLQLTKMPKKDKGDEVPHIQVSKPNTIQQCDLLEVYNDGDKDRLKENVQANWKILTSHDPHKIGDCDDDDDSGFKFTTDKDIERDKFLKEAQSETAEKIKLATVSDQLTAEDWISIDDL